MSKYIVIAVVAFGGLFLISTLIFDNESVTETADVVMEPSAALPDEVQKNFPVYPGDIKSVRDDDSEESIDLSVSISVQATKQEVNEWYRDELKQNGWSIKSDKNVAGYQIIQGENENFYTSIQATSGDAEGETIINQQIKIRK